MRKLISSLPLVAVALLLGSPATFLAQDLSESTLNRPKLTTAKVIYKSGKKPITSNNLLLRVQPASAGMMADKTLKLEAADIKQIAAQDPLLAATLYSLSKTGLAEWGQVSWIPVQFTPELVAEWVDSEQKFKDFYEINKERFTLDRTKSMIRFTYTAEATNDPEVMKVTISQEAIAKQTRRK
jgi:hypothetical protein